MMMKKSTLLIFICLMGWMSACEPPYDGTEIVAIENEFLDSQGNRVANLPVKYTTGSSSGFDLYYEDSFNYLTDSQGKIRFSTFKPNELLYVNYEGNALYGPIYTPLLNLDPKKLNTQRFYLLQSNESVDLNVQLQTTNFTKSIKEVTFTGIGNLIGYPYSTNEMYNYRVRTNQTVTIHYTVFNFETNTTTTLSQNISIITDNLTFVINY
jgi:hypothetical protein